MPQLPAEEFNTFLAQWRRVLYRSQEDSNVFIRGFLTGKENYCFSNEQLESIAGLIRGNDLYKVILPLGDTRINQNNVVSLQLMSTHLSIVQISYPPQEKDYKLIKTLPDVNLEYIMQKKKNTLLTIDKTKLVLNSSHHFTTTPRTTDIFKVIMTLQKAHADMLKISTYNETLACEIENIIKKKYSRTVQTRFQEITLEISGFSLKIDKNTMLYLANDVFMPSLKDDAKNYNHWAKVFTVLSNLLSNTSKNSLVETYEQQLRPKIDEKILLFKDFVSLKQNEGEERHKTEQESLSSKEIKIMNNIAKDLINNAASPNAQSVKYLFNATGLITTSSSNPLISTTSFLSKGKLILFLNELAPKINTDSAKVSSILQAIKATLIEATPDKIAKIKTKNQSKPLSEYDSLCEQFSSYYERALTIISGMRSLGLASAFIDKDDEDIKSPSLSNLESFLDAQVDQIIEKNSPATLLMECLDLFFAYKNTSSLNTDLTRGLREEILPALNRRALTHERSLLNTPSQLASYTIFAQQPASPPGALQKDTTYSSSKGGS